MESILQKHKSTIDSVCDGLYRYKIKGLAFPLNTMFLNVPEFQNNFDEIVLFLNENGIAKIRIDGSERVIELYEEWVPHIAKYGTISAAVNYLKAEKKKEQSGRRKRVRIDYGIAAIGLILAVLTFFGADKCSSDSKQDKPTQQGTQQQTGKRKIEEKQKIPDYHKVHIETIPGVLKKNTAKVFQVYSFPSFKK